MRQMIRTGTFYMILDDKKWRWSWPGDIRVHSHFLFRDPKAGMTFPGNPWIINNRILTSLCGGLLSPYPRSLLVPFRLPMKRIIAAAVPQPVVSSLLPRLCWLLVHRLPPVHVLFLRLGQFLIVRFASEQMAVVEFWWEICTWSGVSRWIV